MVNYPIFREEEVLEWLVRQRTEDTIEEVTEEILKDLIEEREYVLVFFAPDSCKECFDILHHLEQIDDDTDEHGILFVTTDDLHIAKSKAKLKKFPALVLFRNGEALIYDGDLTDQVSILKWVTSEEALDHPEQIEEINAKMLDKMLDKSAHVAVLFLKVSLLQTCCILGCCNLWLLQSWVVAIWLLQSWVVAILLLQSLVVAIFGCFNLGLFQSCCCNLWLFQSGCCNLGLFQSGCCNLWLLQSWVVSILGCFNLVVAILGCCNLGLLQSWVVSILGCCNLVVAIFGCCKVIAKLLQVLVFFLLK